MRNEENTIKVYADKILFIFASLYNMNEVLTGQLDIFGSHRTSENKSTFHPISSFFLIFVETPIKFLKKNICFSSQNIAR